MNFAELEEAYTIAKEQVDLSEKLEMKTWRISYLGANGRWIVYRELTAEDIDQIIRPMLSERVDAICSRLDTLGVSLKAISVDPVLVDQPVKPIGTVGVVDRLA